jgi:lysophospholipase L1-like esterase
MTLTVKLALAPLLLAQGRWARQHIPRLPEPPGAREGVLGDGHETWRLLVVGDSSAAGVGVDDQRDALAWPLARALAARAGRRVAWRLVARSGVTTAQALALLQQQEAARWPADVAVVVTGVNDVIDQVPTSRAVAARAALRDWLKRECAVRHIVFTPLPPMGHFAGLPQPLRWVMGQDAQRHDRALLRWARRHPDVTHLRLDLPLDAAQLASDGFHPGAPVYRQWSTTLAEHICERQTSGAPAPRPAKV